MAKKAAEVDDRTVTKDKLKQAGLREVADTALNFIRRYV
jgi:hypothetical protein